MQIPNPNYNQNPKNIRSSKKRSENEVEKAKKKKGIKVFTISDNHFADEISIAKRVNKTKVWVCVFISSQSNEARKKIVR